MATREQLGDISPVDVYLNLQEQIAAATGAVLPPLPEEDGSYYLQLVIDDGIPGIVWEAEA